MVRGLKSRIKKVEGLYYLSAKTKALITFASLFSICKTPVFSRHGSNISIKTCLRKKYGIIHRSKRHYRQCPGRENNKHNDLEVTRPTEIHRNRKRTLLRQGHIVLFSIIDGYGCLCELLVSNRHTVTVF